MDEGKGPPCRRHGHAAGVRRPPRTRLDHWRTSSRSAVPWRVIKPPLTTSAFARRNFQDGRRAPTLAGRFLVHLARSPAGSAVPRPMRLARSRPAGAIDSRCRSPLVTNAVNTANEMPCASACGASRYRGLRELGPEPPSFGLSSFPSISGHVPGSRDWIYGAHWCISDGRNTASWLSLEHVVGRV